MNEFNKEYYLEKLKQIINEIKELENSVNDIYRELFFASDKKVIKEMNDIFVSREEAAKILGVKPGTLSVWASTKKYPLKYIKVGSKVRYKKSDLDEFLYKSSFTKGL